MNHQRGECFMDRASHPGTACLHCTLWSARAQGGSELSLDIGDDYEQALRAVRAWLAHKPTRGFVTTSRLKDMLRGLRFSRLRVGVKKEQVRKAPADYSWAKLIHESGRVFEGFGVDAAEAVVDAIESYLRQVTDTKGAENVQRHA